MEFSTHLTLSDDTFRPRSRIELTSLIHTALDEMESHSSVTMLQPSEAYDSHGIPRNAAATTSHSATANVPIELSSLAPSNMDNNSGIDNAGVNFGAHENLSHAASGAAAAEYQLPNGALFITDGHECLCPQHIATDTTYNVPNPTGRGFVHYSFNTPMPPMDAFPSVKEQWNSQTRPLKMFFVLTILSWIVILAVRWRVGLFIPILFIPTLMLYIQWRKKYQTVELYLLHHVYAKTIVPGALLVIGIELLLKMAITLIIFQNFTVPATADPFQSSNFTDHSFDEPGATQLFLYKLLNGYLVAGFVEESLKYFCINSVTTMRPSYKKMDGLLLYSIATALGFSTFENIIYVVAGSFNKKYSSPGTMILLCFLRLLISTPVHVTQAYLTGLQVVRRQVLGENLNFFEVVGWSIFFHGTFDFALFMPGLIKAIFSVPTEHSSLLVIAAIYLTVFGATFARIRHVKSHITQAIANEAPQEVDGNNVADGVDIEAAGHVVPLGSARSNGFSRLENQQVA